MPSAHIFIQVSTRVVVTDSSAWGLNALICHGGNRGQTRSLVENISAFTYSEVGKLV